MRIVLGLALWLAVAPAWAQEPPLPPVPPPVMPDVKALNPCWDYQYAPGSLDYNPPCWQNLAPPARTKDIAPPGEVPPEVLIPIPYSHINERPFGCPQCPATATQKALEAQQKREEERAKGDPLKGLGAEQYAKERQKLDQQAAEEFKRKFDERAKAAISNQQKLEAEAKQQAEQDVKKAKEVPEPPQYGLVPPPEPIPPPQPVPTPFVPPPLPLDQQPGKASPPAPMMPPPGVKPK